MKGFTVSIAVILLTLGTASLSTAQAAGPAGGAPTAVPQKGRKGPLVVEREVLAKLDLDKGQKAQIKDLLKKLGGKLKEMREPTPSSADKADLKDKRKQLFMEYLGDLKKVLKPSQLTKYRDIHRELRKKRAQAQP